MSLGFSTECLRALCWCLAQLVAEVGWVVLESCRDYFYMSRNT
jgi:hypothetical protein